MFNLNMILPEYENLQASELSNNRAGYRQDMDLLGMNANYSFEKSAESLS